MHSLFSLSHQRLLALSFAMLCVGCGSGIADEEAARLVYLGVDGAVERALNLGFDGYNAASSANIPAQSGAGDLSGTMEVSGKVDQGVSNNKEMGLSVTLSGYSDGAVEDTSLVYDSSAPLDLDLSLKGLPDASLSGAFAGEVIVSGDLEGPVALELTIVATTEEAPDDPGRIRRVSGSTRVTGTATSDYGVYRIDVTR